MLVDVARVGNQTTNLWAATAQRCWMHRHSCHPKAENIDYRNNTLVFFTREMFFICRAALAIVLDV